MKLTFKLLALVTLLFGMCSHVFAETSVIVHASNDSAELSAKQVQKIFLGKKKKFSNGKKIVPIAQDEDSPVTAEFNAKLLKKSDSQMKSYWSKLVFTGKGTPPKIVGGDAEVLKMVAGDPNMIGYVGSSVVDDSVKVIFRF